MSPFARAKPKSYVFGSIPKTHNPRYWKGKVSGRKITDHVHVPMLGIDQDRQTVDSGDALIIPPAVDFIGREIISDSSWKIN